MRVTVQESSPRALALMERVQHAGGDLAAEYPLVFGPAGSGRVVTLGEGGRVLAACTLLERELALPGGGLRVGLIGSVSTDPEHRRRGLASRVLEAAEDELRAKGCLLALLWADDASFYGRRGYAEVGREVVVLVGPELALRLPLPSGVRAADPAEDAPAVHALYRFHRRRARRSFAETAAALETPGLRTLLRVRRGRVVAYACEGRGHDLGGVVHEWGGPAQDVAACLRAHLDVRREGCDPALFLLAPHAQGELVRALVRAGAATFPGVLAQGKLLDPDGALERIAGHASARLELERLAPDRWRMAHGARSTERDAAQLRELLIAAHASCDAVRELEQDLGVRFPGLPLAPFVWGLDSI